MKHTELKTTNPISRPATSTDVAKLAKVSQSTVSRAFNENSRLSDETRERVRQAANSLGYRPNAIARSLVSNKTKIIGLILMHNESPFYTTMVNMMIIECRQHDYSAMVIRQLPGESGSETVARALDYRVDGIAVTAIEDTESAGEVCKKANIPVVLLNRYIAGAEVDSVCCDNYAAGCMIAGYLARKGHRRIACLMGEATASTTKDRLAGLRSRAEENCLSIEYVAYGDYAYESGREMCRKLLDTVSQLPDVIFCSADIIAFGVMDTLRYEYHLRIPEDISVFGFDGAAEGAWASYNLTTIQQPYKELAENACDLLVRRIEHRAGSTVRSLNSGTLVERGSVLDKSR